MTNSRKRGRPPKPAEEVKRHALGVRTTRALKEKLEAAAATTGRSLAQEVELRLEQSFQGADHIAIPLGLLRNLIEAAEARTGEKWNEDYMTWVAASKAARLLMDIYKPAPPNKAAIAEAEKAYTEQVERWRPSTLSGIPEMLEGASPLDAEAYAKAIEEREASFDSLKSAAAPARTMFSEGAAVFEEIADMYRLTPRKD